MDLTRLRRRGLGRYQISLWPAYRTLYGPSGRGRQRCVARRAIRQGRNDWSWTLKTQRLLAKLRGAQRDRDPGPHDRARCERDAVPTQEDRPEGVIAEHLARANPEGRVHGLLRRGGPDERDPPRPVSGRAGAEHRRGKDAPLVGPGRR